MEVDKFKELVIHTLGQEVYDQHYKDMMMGEQPMMGMPTSFAQLLESKKAEEVAEQVYDLSNMFRMLAFNIATCDMVEDKVAALQSLADEYINLVEGASNAAKSGGLLDWLKELNPFHDKAVKTEGGKKFPKSAYLYTPSDNPSEWKLRIQDMSGKVTKEQLGAAAAAFSAGGFRGNRVKLPAESVASVKAKLRSEYKKLGVKPEEMPDSVKESSFMVFKDNSNTMRWMAIHTNNYEDEDTKPEIIASFAHKEFVEAVEEGRAEYPELWGWHASPASAIGKADMLHYDEETGFMLSSGKFYEGKEHVAKGLAEFPYPMRVSHGMPKESLIYQPGTNVIVHYRSREISPLPYGAEANKLTMFAIS